MTNLREFKPFVIKDVFSDEQYRHIYDSVNKTFPKELAPDVPSNLGYVNVPDLGYFAYTKGFEESIYEHVRKITEDATGLSLDNAQIHFARYTNKTGSAPLLRPHNDQMLEYPSITLSIQLDSTLDWELCAYDTCDTLQSNQALVFSGSDQIHWRPRVDFKDDDYFDIMVCQMTLSGSEKLDATHADEMFNVKRSVLEEFFKLYPENVNNLPKESNMPNA